jgi:hypothetical protein
VSGLILERGIRLTDLKVENGNPRQALTLGGRLPSGPGIGQGLSRLGQHKRRRRAKPECDTGRDHPVLESEGSSHVSSNLE